MTAPIAPVTKGTICGICGNTLRCRWTDQHGVGACLCCGAPYKILHRDKQQRLLDKPPLALTREEWVPTLKRYWEEKHRNVDPGAYNFPGSSYEVATQEDVDALNSWIEEHKDELPE